MSLKYSSFSVLGLLINWSSVWGALFSKLSNTDCTVEKCRTGRSRTKLSNMLTTIPSARSLLNLFQFRSSVTGSTIWYFIKLKKMSSQFFLVFCPFCWQLNDLQSKGFQLFVCFLFCFVCFNSSRCNKLRQFSWVCATTGLDVVAREHRHVFDCRVIGHFWVPKVLTFKTRLSVKRT